MTPCCAVERVDAVETVVVGGHVIDEEALQRRELRGIPRLVPSGGRRRRPVLIVQPREEHAVEGRAGHGEVLHAHAVSDRDDAVRAQAAAVDDGPVAILPPHRDIGGVDEPAPPRRCPAR